MRPACQVGSPRAHLVRRSKRLPLQPRSRRTGRVLEEYMVCAEEKFALFAGMRCVKLR